MGGWVGGEKLKIKLNSGQLELELGLSLAKILKVEEKKEYRKINRRIRRKVKQKESPLAYVVNSICLLL